MPDEMVQENSLKRNIEERVAFIRDNRKRGGPGYSVAVTESARLIELAIHELIRRYLQVLKEPAHRKFLDEERKIGAGNDIYRSFTMGKLVGLVRASRFFDALSEAVGLNLAAVRLVSLDLIVELRNAVTHNNHQATAAEADLVFSALKAFLETLGILVLEEQNASGASTGPNDVVEMVQRPIVWNVPYERNPYFTGREAELSALADALTQAPSGKIQALSGLGGIGKTQIAIEYAYRCREGRKGYPGYEAILFTRADTPTALLAGYTAIARALGLIMSRPDDPQQVAAEVRHWLETHDRWLLLCDNTDDPDLLEPYRPRNARGHLLLTSRAHRFKADLGIKRPITLHTLRPDEAIAFLFDRSGRIPEDESAAERQTAAQLAADLGYFPLALEQAAGYIVAQEKRFAAYLQDFRKREQELLNASPPETGDYRTSANDREYRTVATTWDLNFRVIEEADPASAELLRLSAFLAPDAIPAEIIIGGAAQLGPPLSDRFADLEDETAIERAYDDLLAPLLRYSLIEKDREARTYSLHRMVQSVQRDRLKTDRRDWSERVARIVCAVFPNVEFGNWDQCARLLAHALACLEHARKEKVETKERGLLSIRAGSYLNERGLYIEVELLFLEGAGIYRTILPDGHPEIAFGLNCLAILYANQGRYAEAEPLHVEALAIRRKALPEEHPDIASSLNYLAVLYANQGRYVEAEPLYQEALTIRRKTLSEEHPATAVCLTNLAMLYANQGRYAEAEPLHVEALAIRRKALPEGHPDIASSLNYLAVLYANRNRAGEAEPLHVEALAIRRKALPEGHPDIALSLNYLAVLYANQGRYTEAEPLYKEALAICVKALPEGHPSLAQSLNNLAVLYANQDRSGEAEPLYREALAMQRKALPQGHPSLAQSLKNLAALYRSQGRPAEAEPLLVEALTIVRTALPEGHPDIAASLNDLALLHSQQGRYSEAEPLYREALAICVKTVGTQHPYTQIVFNNVVQCLLVQERRKEATILSRQIGLSLPE